ncbi:hypothetical protein J3E64_001922 [Sphingobium sp. OAS761]|uniref:hypothetical protein n=1 Tax=Sphingobium sp. OAS761 TaxID=2817901 RepID=UPI00209D4704|nr:hypothetical protein [Sphingobium sp. OAS761]MCP1470234.1 hypothetical protein [Sphingobium sp. OAS761]
MTKSKIIDPATYTSSPEKAATAIPHGIGQISRLSDATGSTRFMTDPYRAREDTVAFMNTVQKYAVEQTRLGIPLLFHEELRTDWRHRMLPIALPPRRLAAPRPLIWSNRSLPSPRGRRGYAA